MRAIVLVGFLCACGASSSSVRRSLVTDNVHLGDARADVIAWHEAHDWCRGRALDDADEFQECQVAMLEQHTPPVSGWIEYRDGKVSAMAVFVPVPCRVTGFCDHAQTSVQLDALYAPGGSRIGRLASEGLHREPPPDMPSMQRKMIDALAVELDARYGPATWANTARSAITWTSAGGEHIGLFLSDDGDWVIETHLFGPP